MRLATAERRGFRGGFLSTGFTPLYFRRGQAENSNIAPGLPLVEDRFFAPCSVCLKTISRRALVHGSNTEPPGSAIRLITIRRFEAEPSFRTKLPCLIAFP